jgi:hypothetical protein
MNATHVGRGSARTCAPEAMSSQSVLRRMVAAARRVQARLTSPLRVTGETRDQSAAKEAGSEAARSMRRNVGGFLASSEDSIAARACFRVIPDLNTNRRAAPRSGERQSSGRSPQV